MFWNKKLLFLVTLKCCKCLTNPTKIKTRFFFFEVKHVLDRIILATTKLEILRAHWHHTKFPFPFYYEMSCFPCGPKIFSSSMFLSKISPNQDAVWRKTQINMGREHLHKWVKINLVTSCNYFFFLFVNVLNPFSFVFVIKLTFLPDQNPNQGHLSHLKNVL